MRGLALALAIIGLGVGTVLMVQPFAHAQGNQRALLKLCRATNNVGRQVTWGCSSNQSCCFNEATNSGYCGPVGGRC